MILIDGRLEDRLSAFDRGLAYGDGVFRTMRACRGCIPHWRRHYAKLLHDCRRLSIVCPPEVSLQNDVRRILAAEPDCVVKIVVTRGQGGRGYAATAEQFPLRIVASFPLPAVVPDRARLGVRVRWCETRVSVQAALAGVKHLNRLDSVLARQEWTGAEIAEGLMLDPQGQVVEGTMSNVFILEGQALATPILDQAGVAGVQRERLLSLASRLDLTPVEARITPRRLLAADQVYVTNSVIGLWWVSSLDERRWEALPITAELIRLAEQDEDD